MPRTKNTTIRKKAKEDKVVETKPIKQPTKEHELQFLGEWLAQEYLSIELNYNPLEEHHPTRNNKLASGDGKDPNGRSVEIKTMERGDNTYFVLSKEDIESFSKAQRRIICEYTDTNTIGLWEVLDITTQVKYKQNRLPGKQLQLLLSFDNQEFAEKMRDRG